MVTAHNRIALARAWGRGGVASADGMRFVVSVPTIHATPNPKYFNRGRGVSWYNLLSDSCPGAERDHRAGHVARQPGIADRRA
ncbi:hypothetical protein PSP20601_04909 [Pandoraea sputorum]|nr:hypothetical protein PSP20601_04909 [Pandoraea sputorum]